MIFQTASKNPRPIRLKESTRKWAFESLHGIYGDNAMEKQCINLDHIENF